MTTFFTSSIGSISQRVSSMHVSNWCHVMKCVNSMYKWVITSWSYAGGSDFKHEVVNTSTENLMGVSKFSKKFIAILTKSIDMPSLLHFQDTGGKLNVLKMFRTSLGRLLNFLCTLNLRPVSEGMRRRDWN